MKFFDRVKETSSTAGIGALTVSGADAGFVAFSSVLSVPDTFYYCIQSKTPGEWETGIGTYSAANTITRTTPLSGSAATPINFSAGDKDVFITVDAHYFSSFNSTPGEEAAASQEPTGFPVDPSTGEIDMASSAVTWDDGTRTITIAPTGASFDYYYQGKRITISSPVSVAITDTEGLWFFYLDGNGDAQATQTFAPSLLYNSAYFANVYWDATNNIALAIGEERHGLKMDGHTHLRLHQRDGTIYLTGLGINTITIDQSGDTNSHAQFGVDAGSIKDEDILLSRSATVAANGCPVLWRSGASAWRMTANAGYSVLTTGTGRLAYNQFTGGAWQQTEVSDANYVLCHIFGTNDATHPCFAVMGQAIYGSITTARDGAATELAALITSGLPVVEYLPIATIIFQTANAYANAVKARVRSTTSGGTHIDWRSSRVSPAAGTSGLHSALGGLDYASAGHTGFVPGTRTVNGNALSADVTLDTGDISDSTDKRYVTDAELVVISNTSNSNTGDQTLPVKASGAEIIAGTDDAKFATAKALVDAGIVASPANKILIQQNFGGL